MTFEELKSAVMNLSPSEQKRFIVEIVPALWPRVCVDDSCVASVRDLVDEDTVRRYREEHLGGI